MSVTAPALHKMQGQQTASVFAAVMLVAIFCRWLGYTGYFGSDEVTYTDSAFRMVNGDWRLDGYVGANRLGVKGSGQAGAIAAPATIMNAVMNALAPLGVKHLDMPATPSRIWHAIRAADATRTYGDPDPFYGRPGYAYGYWRPAWRYHGGGYGWRGWDPFWGDPFWGDTYQSVDRYEASAEIIMHHGAKPEGERRAFDAHEVMTNLGPTIVRPS